MKIIKIIFCIAIIIFCAQFSYSKYTTTITGEGTVKTGNAIIALEEGEAISNAGEISYNNRKLTYSFSVKNFERNNLSDINYKYTINIKGLENLDGVIYRLYRSDNGNEITPIQNGIYQGYDNFKKNQESIHNYKLEIECLENQLKSVERNVKISCDAEQI